MLGIISNFENLNKFTMIFSLNIFRCFDFSLQFYDLIFQNDVELHLPLDMKIVSRSQLIGFREDKEIASN